MSEGFPVSYCNNCQYLLSTLYVIKHFMDIVSHDLTTMLWGFIGLILPVRKANASSTHT